MLTQSTAPSPLWQPGTREFKDSSLARFAARCGFEPSDYDALHRWSTSQSEAFWNELWDFTQVIGSRGDVTLERSSGEAMFGARWYPNGTLNFAENLLCGDDGRLAVIEANERGDLRRVTMGELRAQVSRAQQGLRKLGVTAGDTVGGILPNNADALVVLLACASIGAIWSSCSPDFGAPGIIDRIGQVNPKVLFAVSEYQYNGRRFHLGENLAEVLRGLHGLQHVVLVGDAGSIATGTTPCMSWSEFNSAEPRALQFEQLSFRHPLYVMFTSGTTGLPKGIVHTAGGVLLEHRKEHMLHCDVRPGDVMSWYTNTAWMMYHWVISGLASHAAVVLYDGAPIVKTADGLDLGMLWRMAEAAGVTHFGTSPRYLATLQESGYLPGRQHDLRALRSVLSAGAPVQPEQFDWLYQSVKQDMIFASISGGTEIIGCFVMGSPLHAIRRGEIPCKGLGLAVDVLDERGASVIGRKGDLVCTEPFPSAPLTFWGDNGDARYRAAYFEARPGIWTHGDLAEQTVDNAVVIYGRSDTTLKPGGVRIGTAEIYRVVESQPSVEDAIVFGVPVGGDEEIVLCVVAKDGNELTSEFAAGLRDEIRKRASPRHVPRHVFQVSSIPYTLNHKRVEGAAKATATGQAVKNLGSIINPESLAQYADLMQRGTL
ncbi:acetoacetate-CoA ligase [Paraburkholderia ginsengiterrae]|uniref:Acetoacetate-CoA ligase n=1 Tax=Paraburkholderia ginsengiterrae TaxID=1462993 RepID=A0A1A9N253_9BURK|nr:acetoacetate--CoA ligase [Paraburkholderia ginsengiterrae]OAJ55994.1 acetoacetate-CoA ligase [Paraburkholderia ginsengiterrae]OAJ58549.1 acetoacetate-CoA ligase [Paraburkholderia ginsengiterrae]